MTTPTLRVLALRENAALPAYGSDYAAGADLCACVEEPWAFQPGETKLVPTGLAVEVPAGYAGLIYARSGLAAKRGLAPANKVGVVDADYRGEVMVALHNHSNTEQKIQPGERVAQLVVTPFLRVAYEWSEALEDTARGAGVFVSKGTAPSEIYTPVHSLSPGAAPPGACAAGASPMPRGSTFWWCTCGS
jgi:dUTP pyrophosphatase